MINFHLGSVLLRSVPELEHAARIGCDDSFGLVAATDCIFSLRRCWDISGWVMLYIPALPQQRSEPSISLNCSPGIDFNKFRGWLRMR